MLHCRSMRPLVFRCSTRCDKRHSRCRIALKERSPSLRDLIFDMESLAVSKASTAVEDVPVRTVIMGEACPERKETGKSQRFVCLIGEKGKVLLTFFTAQ